MVGIDMIRNNRIVNRIKYTVEQKSMIWICIWNICNLQLRWKFSFDQRIFSFLSEGSSWSLELELPMQSVPNTTILVSWNPAHGEVYMIQNYAIKFVSDLQQVGGCFWVLWFPPPIKLTETWRSLALPVSQPNAWEILLLSNMEVMEKRVGVHALQPTNTTFRTGNKYVKVSHYLAIILGYKHFASTSHVIVFFYVQCLEVRGGCLFCWYCWNSWLLKLYFHNWLLDIYITRARRNSLDPIRFYSVSFLWVSKVWTRFSIVIFSVLRFVRG